MSQQSTQEKRPALSSWLALTAIALLLILLFHSDTFRNLLHDTTTWAKHIMEARPAFGALVFFLFSALSAMLAFTSSAVLVPPANLVWGKMVTFLLLWGGWLAGAIVAFGIGNAGGPLLVRLGFDQKLKRYRDFVSKRMSFWLVVLFCIAVPSEVPGYLFGGLHYPFWKFVGAVAIAESIYAIGLVLAGESLTTSNPFLLMTAVAALVLIALLAGWLLKRLRQRRRSKTSVA